MESKGFEGTLSEKSKEALQSETWQKVRDSMKERREVRRFTAENTAENAYGWKWEQVVKEYLKNGYNAADSSPDIVVMGETYKTLKRPTVTVFYDDAGDTLFDVTNERLEKEYEWLMNSGTVDAAEGMDADEENAKPVKQRAKEKLEKEMKADKDKTFAEPVIGYLLKRCEEDEGLAQDVVQEHKTWKKCFDYIYSQARKQTKGKCAAVRDDVVYEWAEDYYHKDDKAEEEKKAKEAAERKKKQEERAKKTKSEPQKTETPKAKEEPKPKKNSRDMDGQLDMFSIMGM